MGDNKTRHQHWVPQFYLRYFSTADTRFTKTPKVVVVGNNLDDEVTYITSVRNVCGKRFLYTPENIDGSRDRSLDDWLDKIESLAAEVWARLSDDIELINEPSHRSVVAVFVATMYLRNVKLFDLVESTIDLRNRLYGTPTRAAMDIRDPKCFDLLNPRSAYRQMFLDSFQTALESFATKNWRVYSSDVDRFITSDRPVAVFAENSVVGSPHASGSTTVFPISQRHVLMIGDSVEVDGGNPIRADDVICRSFNKLMHVSCLNIIISGRPLSEVLLDVG